jgi:hypothetical protein
MLIEQYQASSGARSTSWVVRGRELSKVAAALGPASQPAASKAGSTEPQPTVEDSDPEVSEEAIVFSSPTEEPQPTKRPRRAWYRRWWVWTIIGVAVAGGAATGLYFGLRNQGGGEDLTLEVQGHW